MGEEKKGGKLKKIFLFAFFASLIGAAVKYMKGRRGGEENEWQELPPPDSR